MKLHAARLVVAIASLAMPVATAVVASSASCGGSLPTPQKGPPPPTSAYVEVPYAPPPGNIEIVPARPESDAVYIDGQWSSFSREKWTWDLGGWVKPPPGSSFTKWAVQRSTDGRLYFAAPTWYGADGGPLAEAPAFLSRARRGEPTGKGIREDGGRIGREGEDRTDASELYDLTPLIQDASLAVPTLTPAFALPPQAQSHGAAPAASDAGQRDGQVIP